MIEVERLQNEIQQAKHATEMNHITADTLKREVINLIYVLIYFYINY